MGRRLALAALLMNVQLAAQASSPDIIVANSEGGALPDFIPQILGAAYRELGLTMAIKSYPVARSIEMANDGLADAEALRGAGMERDYPDLVQVPESIVNLDYRVFTLTDPSPVSGWEGLADKRVCINHGEKVIESRTRGLPREEAHGVDAAFRMLRAGRCEAVIANQFAWLTIDRLNLGRFCAGPAIIETVPLYHYVNRRHAALAPRLAKALRHLRDDGTIESALGPELASLAAARARHECTEAGDHLKDAAPR